MRSDFPGFETLEKLRDRGYPLPMLEDPVEAYRPTPRSRIHGDRDCRRIRPARRGPNCPSLSVRLLDVDRSQLCLECGDQLVPRTRLFQVASRLDVISSIANQGGRESRFGDDDHPVLRAGNMLLWIDRVRSDEFADWQTEDALGVLAPHINAVDVQLADRSSAIRRWLSTEPSAAACRNRSAALAAASGLADHPAEHDAASVNGAQPAPFDDWTRRHVHTQAWEVWARSIEAGASYPAAAEEAVAAGRTCAGERPGRLDDLPVRPRFEASSFPTLSQWMLAEWVAAVDQHLIELCDAYAARHSTELRIIEHTPEQVIAVSQLGLTYGRFEARSTAAALLAPHVSADDSAGSVTMAIVPAATAVWLASLYPEGAVMRLGNRDRSDSETTLAMALAMSGGEAPELLPAALDLARRLEHSWTAARTG